MPFNAQPQVLPEATGRDHHVHHAVNWLLVLLSRRKGSHIADSEAIPHHMHPLIPNRLVAVCWRAVCRCWKQSVDNELVTCHCLTPH